MANYREDIVSVELTSGNIYRSFLNHSIGEGDALANRFGIRAFRNGEPEDLSGVCTGYFIRPTGDTVVIDNGVISGNVAYITLPAACYVNEGQFSLAIKVANTDDGITTTMRIVDGVVCNTETGSYVDPGTIIPSIEDLIDAIENAIATIPADYSSLLGDIAGDYSNTSAYEVGQYAWYNGSLKRCIYPITSGETYNAAHWEDAVIGRDVYSVRQDLYDFEDAELEFNQTNAPEITIEQGGISTSNGTPTTSDNANYYKRLRSANYIQNERNGYFILYIPPGFECMIMLYSQAAVSSYQGTYKSNSWLKGRNIIRISNKYLKLVFRTPGNDVIGPSDLPTADPLLVFVHPEAVYDLYPSGDETPRGAEIIKILQAQKVCRLAPGDYYTNNFVMPEGTALVGAGMYATRLIINDETAPYYCIRVRARCTVSDLTLEKYQENGDITPIADYTQGMHGIRIGHNTDAGSTEEYGGAISNVYIKNFEGCGVFQRHSGTGTNGFRYSNVRVENCSAGIYLGENAEYNQVIGCYARLCYTGIVVMGGNNIIDSCVASSNEVNMSMPNTDGYGASNNDGHGIVQGCKFTHAGYYSGTYPGDGTPGGYDLLCGAQSSAELVANCFIGYPVYVGGRDQPLSFTGCQIRRNATIMSDNSRIFMSDCIWQDGTTSATVANGGVIIRRDCMDYNGTELPDVR